MADKIRLRDSKLVRLFGVAYIGLPFVTLTIFVHLPLALKLGIWFGAPAWSIGWSFFYESRYGAKP